MAVAVEGVHSTYRICPGTANVAHFWDRGSDLLDGINRDGVSQYLDDLQRDHYPDKRFHLDTFGTRSSVGRNSIQLAYLHSLLEYKIVVVCQRGYWEGRYRLME